MGDKKLMSACRVKKMYFPFQQSLFIKIFLKKPIGLRLLTKTAYREKKVDYSKKNAIPWPLMVYKLKQAKPDTNYIFQIHF